MTRWIWSPLWQVIAISGLFQPLLAAPTATVLNGTYEGLHLPSFDQDLFLGIPYAQDTGGQNRFRIPQALNETWTGVRPATQYGHACPDFTPEADGEFGMSENCLSINIVKPAGLKEGDKLPVALWIHGGRYVVFLYSIIPVLRQVLKLL